MDALDGGQQAGLDGQVGLGVDIVEIARMKAILERTPSFARKVYSEEERAYCEGKALPGPENRMRPQKRSDSLEAGGSNAASRRFRQFRFHKSSTPLERKNLALPTKRVPHGWQSGGLPTHHLGARAGAPAGARRSPAVGRSRELRTV